MSVRYVSVRLCVPVCAYALNTPNSKSNLVPMTPLLHHVLSAHDKGFDFKCGSNHKA